MLRATSIRLEMRDELLRREFARHLHVHHARGGQYHRSSADLVGDRVGGLYDHDNESIDRATAGRWDPTLRFERKHELVPRTVVESELGIASKSTAQFARPASHGMVS